MNRIAEALFNSGLTQIELSNKTGIGKGLISRYVSGKVSPKSTKANLIAKALGVSTAWLMGFDVDMKRETDEEMLKASETLEDEMSRRMLEQITSFYNSLSFGDKVSLFELIRKEESKHK